MNRPGPAMTIFDGLFLNQFTRCKLELLTQFGYQLQNCRIYFCIENFTCFGNYSVSRKAIFSSFVHTFLPLTQKLFISHEKTSLEL